jgi:hypothetical protein
VGSAGKTALLAHALESATDVRVLRAAGIESEMELPFAALHQLCAPMLDALWRLPDPQREALNIVFGRSAGPRPDPFMVGLAVLSLMSEIAAERPLLCVVDDAQWLDKATAQTLTLVARRLRAEAVGLVFGARETGEEFRGVPQLEAQGFATATLAPSWARSSGSCSTSGCATGSWPRPGEIPSLFSSCPATQLAGGFGLSGPHALPGRIERSFAQQVDLLPPETRSLLLIAAAEPVGDPLLVWRAAERLGIESSTAAAVEMDGLLTITERVTFRHPLVRSAVYRSASLRERRAAHLALAEATDREADPDRRAWHLATASSGPDEDVASELERSARRAQARGGFAAEAAFLHRSVALTEDPTRRSERALAAAQAGLRTGAFDVALGLLITAEAGPLDDLGRARMNLLRAEAAYSLNRGSDAPPLLLRAARTLETLDPRLARETYLDAWSAALFAGRLGTSGDLLEVSRAASAVGAPTEPVRASDLLLDGFSLAFTEGCEATVPVLAKAATAFADADLPVEEVLRWGWLEEATGTHIAPYGTLVHAALKGREDEALPLIEATIESAAAEGQGTAVQYARWASSVVFNALGRYEEALTAAEEASDATPQFWIAAWALSEQIEAAVRSGRPGTRRSRSNGLRNRREAPRAAGPSGWPSARGRC